jgi:hypothetical protein
MPGVKTQIPPPEPQQPTPPAGEEESWNSEQRLEASIKRLDEVHAQLQKIRNTVPTMLQPLVQTHLSPEEMFAALVQSTASAEDDVSVLVKSLEDEEVRGILAHVGVEIGGKEEKEEKEEKGKVKQSKEPEKKAGKGSVTSAKKGGNKKK